MNYVLTTLLFVAIANFSVTFSSPKKVNRLQWHCERLCTKAGGKFNFNPDNKICTCTLGKNTDETDVALIHKNAKIVGIELETIQSENDAVLKREILNVTESTVDEMLDCADFSNETTSSESLNTTAADGEVVGQKAPAYKRLQHHQRFVAQRRHRELRPMSPEYQKVIVQQIRDHLNRLTQANDQRSRQAEIDAVKNNLRQLSQSVIIQTPQQRSRLRNVVEEARKRQQRLHSHILGAQHDLQENEVDSPLKEGNKKMHHFEIITQDPSLIED